MASSFPTAKDVLENPGVGAKLNTTSHRLQHTNANDAIEALQDKVGIDNSTDDTTLDYRVRAAASRLASVSGRNVFLNGDMSVWSLGTGPFTVSGSYSADNVQLLLTTSTASVTQQALDVTDPFAYAVRTAVTSGGVAGSLAAQYFVFNNVRTFAGETVTLSFYARATASGKFLSTEIAQNFGSGGSAQVTSIGTTKIALSTSLTRYSYTFTMPSLAGKTIGTGHFIGILIWFDAGSNWNSRSSSLGNQSGTFDITGMQLERGSVATPFEYINPTIATNTSNIATNTSNIATNTADILVVKNRLHLPNPFRNSSGAIWQRGTTITPAAAAFGPDGYINYYRNDIVWSRQLSGDTQGSGYCIRVQRPNGNSSTTATGIAQSCLTADSVRFAGRQCTYSVRVRKGSGASVGLSLAAAYTGTGTDQIVGVGFTGVSSYGATPSLSTSWQTLSVTFTAGASVTQIGTFITLTWAGTAGANDYFEFKDLRLDEGPSALVHAPLPYAVDLAECQFLLRHYSAENSAYLMLPIAWRECAAIYASNAIVGLLDTPMRAAPTCTKVGAWTVTDGHSGNVLSTLSAAPVVSQTADGQGLFMYCYTGSALTSKQMYFVQANNDTTARMIFSAEI